MSLETNELRNFVDNIHELQDAMGNPNILKIQSSSSPSFFNFEKNNENNLSEPIAIDYIASTYSSSDSKNVILENPRHNPNSTQKEYIIQENVI